MVTWKHIEVGLDHKKLWVTTLKHLSDHKKHKYELINQPKKQCTIIFVYEKIPIKVIMDWRTISAHKFITRLGFKQYVILAKEWSLLRKLMSSFEGKNTQKQYNILGYRTNF